MDHARTMGSVRTLQEHSNASVQQHMRVTCAKQSVSNHDRIVHFFMSLRSIQCPLYIATLDIAAALPIATSKPVTNLRQYINSDLGYSDLKIQPLCSKIAAVKPFEVAIFNGLCLIVLNFTIIKQILFENSDRAARCL